MKTTQKQTVREGKLGRFPKFMMPPELLILREVELLETAEGLGESKGRNKVALGSLQLEEAGALSRQYVEEDVGGVFDGAIDFFDAVELGNAVDEIRHRFAEFPVDLGIGDRGVFDDVDGRCVRLPERRVGPLVGESLLLCPMKFLILRRDGQQLSQ